MSNRLSLIIIALMSAIAGFSFGKLTAFIFKAMFPEVFQ